LRPARGTCFWSKAALRLHWFRRARGTGGRDARQWLDCRGGSRRTTPP